MKRRTPTDDELQVGEAREVAKLRSRIMAAMAAEADMDAMSRARVAALIRETLEELADGNDEPATAAAPDAR